MKSTEWDVINPRTGVRLYSQKYKTLSQVNSCLKELDETQALWQKSSVKERQKHLAFLVEILNEEKNNFVQAIIAETGKSVAQAKAEVDKSIATLKVMTEKELTFLEDQVIPNQSYKKTILKAEPYGVLLSLMPWNFPVWQVIRMIGPALIAGNTVLLKHSEVSPKTGDLFEQVFNQLEAKTGKYSGKSLLRHALFNHQDTEALIASDLVAGVSLTGSVRAGKIIASHCAKYFKKSVLELGGIDAALIIKATDETQNADLLKKAAAKIAQSRLHNSGQVCISTKRVFVQKSDLPFFLEHIKSAFDERLQDTSLETGLVGPLAHANFKKTYNEQVAHLEKTQKLVYRRSVQLPRGEITNLAGTAYVDALIFYIQNPDEFTRNEEIFGPCLQIYSYEDVGSAIQEINHTPYGLGASVYGVNSEENFEWASQIQVGQVAVNDIVKSDVDVPFSGVKMSGYGYELGDEGFKEFVKYKAYSFGALI